MEEHEDNMEQLEKSPLCNKPSLPSKNIPVFKGTPVGSPDGGRAWLVAFAIFVVNFLIIGMGRVSGLFYVDYMEVFHVKRRTASTPFAVQQSIRNLFGPVVGILGQMFSVRALTMTGGLMAAVGAFSCAFASNILWITIFWGDLYGIATAFTSTINQALINMYFLNNRTTASGIAFAGGSLGAMVFPFFIENLLNKWGVQETYFTMAFLLLLIIPVAIVMKKPPWLTPRRDEEEIEWCKLIDSDGSHGKTDSRNKLYKADSSDHDYQSPCEEKDEADELPSKFRSLYERSGKDPLRTSENEGGSLGEVDRKGSMRSSQGFVGKLFNPVVELLKDMFIEPDEEVSSPMKSGTAEKREVSSEGTSVLSRARFHTEDPERVLLLNKKSSEVKPVGFFAMVFGTVVDTLKEMFIEPTEEYSPYVNSETDRVVEDASYRKASGGYGSTKNIDVVVEKSKASVKGTGYEEKLHDFERKVSLSAPGRGERQIRENLVQCSHSIPSSLSATSPPPIFPNLYSSSAPFESSFIYEEIFQQSGISIKAISPVKLPPLSISGLKYSSENIEQQLHSDVYFKSEPGQRCVTSSSTSAMGDAEKSPEKTLVEQISEAPTPHSEAEGYDNKKTMAKSTFSTAFSKFPSIDRDAEDAEFLYGARSSPNEQEEIKKRTSLHPPQKFEVLVENIGDSSPRHELKQKSIKTERKVQYRKKTGSCNISVPVKDTSSGVLTSIPGIEVLNPVTLSLGEQKDADFDPIVVNFKFLHENLRYIMHIVRITEASLIEFRNPTKFHDLASENREFESALEFFFYSLEETVPSREEYVPNVGSRTPGEIIFEKERLGSDPEDGKDLRENRSEFKMKTDFDMSFTNRQIFDLLQVLFCQNESVIASHFPEQDQENVLRVISELKKLIKHCHSMDSKYSNTQGSTLRGSDTREKSVPKTSSIPSRGGIERTMYGSQRLNTITEVDRPSSEQNASSGNTSDIPPLITLWDQVKVAIRLHANPLFLLVCFSRVVHFFAFTGVLTIIVDYGKDRGLSLTSSVFLISALSLGDFIGRLFTGWITDMGIVSLEIFMAISMILQGILSMSFNWAPAKYLYIITAFFSISQGAVFVRYPVLLCKYTKDYEHSVALGFSNFFSGILGFGMPRYIGYFRDTLGSYSQIFSINGGVCLLVGVLWTFVPCYLRLSPP